MPVWRHFMPLKSARLLIGRLNQPNTCGLAPPVAFSRRSGNLMKLSCRVRLAGQVDWNLRFFTLLVAGAGCCADAAAANASAAAVALTSLNMGSSSAHGRTSPDGQQPPAGPS